jgi:predicted nucleic acid-binding Zn ribbon protein
MPAMPTYEYETIPQKAGQRTVRFEIYQPITAKSLTKHPETGEPVQRVISGGLGVFTESRQSPGPSPCATGGCGMGQACEMPRSGGCAGGMCDM